MLTRKLFPPIVLLAVMSASAFGQSTQPAFGTTQSIRVTGTVRYANGTPANEVVVRLERLSGGGTAETRTDRLGKFNFERLAPVQYHLVIRHPGYKEINREVDLVYTGMD